MGQIKGANFYAKFKEGKALTRKQAMLAQCYMCNGEEESAEDCQGKSCHYMPTSLIVARRS